MHTFNDMRELTVGRKYEMVATPTLTERRCQNAIPNLEVVGHLQLAYTNIRAHA